MRSLRRQLAASWTALLRRTQRSDLQRRRTVEENGGAGGDPVKGESVAAGRASQGDPVPHVLETTAPVAARAGEPDVRAQDSGILRAPQAMVLGANRGVVEWQLPQVSHLRSGAGGAWLSGAIPGWQQGRLTVRGASVRGFREYDSEGKDAVVVRRGTRVFLGAADGVSSLRESGVAARRMLQVMSELVSCREAVADSEGLLRQALLDSSAEVTRYLQKHNMEGSCTLAVALLDAGEQGVKTTLLNLGDTAAWRLRDDSWDLLLSQPPAADGTVYAAPLDELYAQSRTVVLEPGSVLALVTDGVGDALGTGQTPYAAALMESWRRPPEPLEFVAQVDYRLLGWDDDKSAVVVWLDA